MKDMNIRKFKLSELNPAKYNPRKALKPGDPEFEKLKRSITEFGYVELIVVNVANNNTVISGHKKAERLSRKELLLGMISELEKTDMMIHEFDEKLWRLMVEKATVGTDGKLTFTLRNGMEIEV